MRLRDPSGLSHAIDEDGHGGQIVSDTNGNISATSGDSENRVKEYFDNEKSSKGRADIIDRLANESIVDQEQGKPYVVKQGPLERALNALGVKVARNSLCNACSLLSAYSVVGGFLLPSDALRVLENAINPESKSVQLDGRTTSNDFLKVAAEVLGVEPLSLMTKPDGSLATTTEAEFIHYNGLLGIGVMNGHFELVINSGQGSLDYLNPGNGTGPGRYTLSTIRPFE